MPSRLANITVVGSINMDLVVRCPALPRPGETRIATTSMEVCGGKGANQAVAAARCGGRVTMVGRVGDDSFAQRLVANLQREGINHQPVLSTPGCASGVAIVAVDDAGQNSIIAVPGANGQVTTADVRAAKKEITRAAVLLLQLEIPIPAVIEAIRIAKAAGVKIVLDPAPAIADLPPELYDVDFICPNETEAATMMHRDVGTLDEIGNAARQLHARGAKHVAITLGDRGTWLLADGEAQLIPAVPIRAVDTTAAGDAFAGALAVQWAQTGNLVAAVRFANAAGAWAATQVGAQPGMGTREQIQSLAQTSA